MAFAQLRLRFVQSVQTGLSVAGICFPGLTSFPGTQSLPSKLGGRRRVDCPSCPGPHAAVQLALALVLGIVHSPLGFGPGEDFSTPVLRNSFLIAPNFLLSPNFHGLC